MNKNLGVSNMHMSAALKNHMCEQQSITMLVDPVLLCSSIKTIRVSIWDTPQQ